MRPTTLALISLSQFLLILEAADKSLDPLTDKPPLPRTALLPAGTNSISVLFQGGPSKTVDELKALALVALKEKKHILDPAGKYQCTVNVNLAAGDESGCTVIFVENFGKPFYQVRFNKFGAIKEVYSGTLREYSGGKITPLEAPPTNKTP